jgi:hypothetical protein
MLGNMDDESKPSQPEQIASVTAPSAPPVVHELSVAPEYALGALDFATPVLTSPVTPLYVPPAYVLGSLDFSAPMALRGRRIQAQVAWGSVGGRPRKIPDPLKPGLIATVEAYVVEELAKRSATDSSALFQTSTTIVNFAQGLAKDAGVMVSDTVLIRQVIKPAINSAKAKHRIKN